MIYVYILYIYMYIYIINMYRQDPPGNFNKDMDKPAFADFTEPGNPWRMDADGPGAPSWDSAMKKG